jgi:sulfite reductase beta subunit-like hemoprotein
MVDDELKLEWAKKEIDIESLMFVDDEEADAPSVAYGGITEPVGDVAFDDWKRTNVVAQRQMVDDELKLEWAKKEIDIESLMFVDDEEADAPSVAYGGITEPVGDVAFDDWKRTNVVAQRQDGFSMVYVRVERGDVYANQWSQLADVARKFAAGRARLDQQQNLVYRWVRTESLYDVYTALGLIGFSVAGRETIRDVVTCPGTDSCKLGITSSMGLNKALGEALDEMGELDPLVENMHIKASGCPNSCGQHHIASIGFHGAVMKGPGGQVPAYELFLGGMKANTCYMVLPARIRTSARFYMHVFYQRV